MIPTVSTAQELSAPSDFDVICGRGAASSRHPGNKRLRTIIKQFLGPYSQAETKMEKSMLVSEIFEAVKRKGDFVRKNLHCGTFEKASKRLAREKIGQILRDELHAKYRSSTKSKTHRRRVEICDMDIQMAHFIQNNDLISSIISSVSRQVQRDILTDQQIGRVFNEANSLILAELQRCQVNFLGWDDLDVDSISDANDQSM